MALTTYLISQASDHLTEKEVQLWLLLFRKSTKYKQYAWVYSDDLENKILATEGTIKARMLNALLKEIDDLGVGEVHIGGDQRTIGAGAGDREGTHWSQTIERESLIEEGLDVLFDDISTLIVPGGGSAVLLPDGTYMRGRVAVGQRGLSLCCPVCNVTYTHRNGVKTCSCS
jgi:hypothetical protein